MVMLDNLLQMHLKLLQKKAIQKTAKVTGDLIGNKIADRITKVSETSPKNNSEIIEEEILRERFIPPELNHKTINDLRLNGESYWLSKIYNYLMI